MICTNFVVVVAFNVFSEMDRFADTAAILISIVSNSYHGMLWGQIHIHLPPEHPIMSFETIEIKMATLSAKRFMKGSLSHNSLWIILGHKHCHRDVI